MNGGPPSLWRITVEIDTYLWAIADPDCLCRAEGLDFARGIAPRRVGCEWGYHVADAAANCNVTPDTVRMWIKTKQLTAFDERRHTYILDAHLRAFRARERWADPFGLDGRAAFLAGDDPLAPLGEAGDLVLYTCAGDTVTPDGGLVACLLDGRGVIRRWKRDARDIPSVVDATGASVHHAQARDLGMILAVYRPEGRRLTVVYRAEEAAPAVTAAD
jgi:hypothetical protein